MRDLAGAVEIDPTPQEVPWSVALDEDDEHATYDPDQVAAYLAAATQAALVLAAFRAPYRGRSTPVNAWWGSFDLAVNLFSGLPADPPSDDFIMRNAMDAQEVAVGWWPGDTRYGKAAFYAYAHPAPEGFAEATLSPAAARWDAALGEYVLDWDDVCASRRPACLRARVRPLGLPPCLPGVRVEPRARRQRGGNAAAGGVTARHASRMRLISRRSLPLARRIAMAMNGAESFEKPVGAPRLRSVIRVAALGRVVPRVRRLHGERPLGGAHHEALAGDDLADLVGVGQAPAEEARDEREPRPDRERPRRLPFDRLDVAIPARRVVGIRRVGGDLGARAADHDLGHDVDGHVSAPSYPSSACAPHRYLVRHEHKPSGVAR